MSPSNPMAGAWEALKWRTGRRGLFLLFLAVLDLAYGWSLYATAGPQRQLDLLLPWQVWGLVWCATGLVCAAGAFMRHDRIPYAVAAMLKTAWAAVFLLDWINGYPRGWVAVAVWAAFAATVVMVSSWPEPSPARKR